MRHLKKKRKTKNLSVVYLLNLQAPMKQKWSNTQAIRQLLPTICLSVYEHFVELALKGLKFISEKL